MPLRELLYLHKLSYILFKGKAGDSLYEGVIRRIINNFLCTLNKNNRSQVNICNLGVVQNFGDLQKYHTQRLGLITNSWMALYFHLVYTHQYNLSHVHIGKEHTRCTSTNNVSFSEPETNLINFPERFSPLPYVCVCQIVFLTYRTIRQRNNF